MGPLRARDYVFSTTATFGAGIYKGASSICGFTKKGMAQLNLREDYVLVLVLVRVSSRFI